MNGKRNPRIPEDIRMRDSITFLPAFAGKNQRSNQFLNWLQQMSTGHLHLDGFESLTATNKNSRYPVGYLLFLAEDEGFEPPQTESESGVLPLHKSSIDSMSSTGTSLLYAFSRKSQAIFSCFENIFTDRHSLTDRADFIPLPPREIFRHSTHDF